jgi:hypothetical protein
VAFAGVQLLEALAGVEATGQPLPLPPEMLQRGAATMQMILRGITADFAEMDEVPLACETAPRSAPASPSGFTQMFTCRGPRQRPGAAQNQAAGRGRCNTGKARFTLRTEPARTTDRPRAVESWYGSRRAE